MELIRKGFRILQNMLPPGKGVHILGYHLVEAGTGLAVDIPLQSFETQMSELRSHATVCSLEEAVGMLENGRIDGTVAVVTFDDAYENFYTTAWPVLNKFQIPASLYVPVNFVEGTCPSPITGTESLPACNWNQLKEIIQSRLITVGSHTFNHPDLTRASLKNAKHEIAESRRFLEEKLAVPVSSFCFPRALWNEDLESIVRESYRTAVIRGGRKMMAGKWNPYRLSRIPIRRSMGEHLQRVLASPVWLEEAAAEKFRSLFPGSKQESYLKCF